jgi:transposase-like protein
LSLYAKGLVTGEISAHFADIYGASISKETISRITDKVVEAVWLQTIVQTCIIHLTRNTFRLTSRRDSDAIKRDIKPIYTAANADAAQAAQDDLEEKWGNKYPAMIRLWRNAWTEFIPFLDYDIEIRKVICSTKRVSRVSWNFGDDPCALYAAAPTVSGRRAVSGWACRRSAATSWGICL